MNIAVFKHGFSAVYYLLGVTESKAVMRILLALGIVLASLVALPYVLRAWPGLPWEVVRFSYVIIVIAVVIVADRVYVHRRSKSAGHKHAS